MALNINSDYHTHLRNESRFENTIHGMAKLIKNLQKKLKFTHMVCTGISGQSVGWPISFITGIPLVVIRKALEKSHGSRIVGQSGLCSKYIIIDDFISSGETIERVIREMKKEEKEQRRWDVAGGDTACAGILLHNSNKSHTMFENTKIPIYYVERKIPKKQVKKA